MWCDKAKNETGSVNDVWRDIRNIFCVFYFMYIVGQTLVSRIEESSWFQQRFIILDSFKVILSFVLFTSHTIVLLFFFLFYGTALHISFFFLCYPSFFLNHVHHLIAHQQQFFVASGMSTSYLNILLTSYHHTIIKKTQHHTETTLRRKEETKGCNKSIWSTSTRIRSSVSSFFAEYVYRSNTDKYSIFCHIINICFVT